MLTSSFKWLHLFTPLEAWNIRYQYVLNASSIKLNILCHSFSLLELAVRHNNPAATNLAHRIVLEIHVKIKDAIPDLKIQSHSGADISSRIVQNEWQFPAPQIENANT